MPQIPPEIKTELITLVKGALAAMVAGAILGFMQYAGTHVVPALQAVLMWASGYAGVKIG